MEIKNLIYLMVGGVIAILMIGSLLIPFVADYTDSTKVYYNNDFGPFADVEKDDTVSITMGAVLGDTTGGSMTVNGEPVIVQQGGRALLLSDNLYIVHNYSYGLAFSGISKSGFVNQGFTDLTLSVANGEISATGTTNGGETESYVFDYEWCYYRANSGDYRMLDFLSSDRTVYFNEIEQIKSAGYINTTGEFYSLSGYNVAVTDNNLVRENVTATATVTDVMNGVSSVVVSSDRTNSSAFKFSVDNGGVPYDVYPYYFVIPAKVYGITEQNTVINSMFSIIPVIFVAGVVVTVAYWAIGRK